MNLFPALPSLGLALLFLAFIDVRGEVYAQSSPPLHQARVVHSDQYGDSLPDKVLMRLGSLRFRHEFRANALLFSPDGKILASQHGEDPLLKHNEDTIILSDAATGRVRQRLSVAMANNLWISAFESVYYRRAFDFTPDGKLLAVVEKQGSIGLWEVDTGKFLRRLALPGKKFDGAILRFSPDGKALIVTVEERKICRIDFATGKVCWQREVLSAGILFDFVFSPDGKKLASVAQNSSSFELWDAEQGKSIRSVKRKSDYWTTSIAFSPDGKLVAVAQYDRVILYHADTGNEVEKIQDDDMREIFGLSYLPNGRMLASCSRDGAIRIWDLEKRKVYLDFRVPLNRSVRQAAPSMALSPDGKTVAMGTDEGTVIHLWDLATGVKSFQGMHGHGSILGMLDLSPDGKTLFSNGRDEKVRLWDLATGKQARRLSCGSGFFSVSSDLRRLALVPDGYFSSSDDPDEPALWDLDKGRMISQLKWEERWRKPFPEIETNGAQFVAGDKFLVTVGKIEFEHDSEKAMGLVLVWDGRTGRRLRKFVLKGIGPLLAVAQHPDGEKLILGTDDSIVLFHLDSGKVLSTLFKNGQGGTKLWLSSSGRLLWLLDLDGKLHCWELSSDRAIRVPEMVDRAPGIFLALSPDGRMMAVEEALRSRLRVEWSTRTPLIRLWNVETGEEVGQLRGHECAVSTGLFSRDGNKLITGLRNGSILVWDVSSFSRRLHESKRLPPTELRNCWDDLAVSDATKAHRAIARLVATPDQAISLLQVHLPLEPPLDAARIRRLIRNLDSDSFTVRQKAAQELEKRIEIAEPFLKNELAKKPSLEVRRRIDQILASASKPISLPTQLRAIRAVEVLERIGNLEAKHLLETLAKWSTEARLTREAKASLERLNQPRP